MCSISLALAGVSAISSAKGARQQAKGEKVQLEFQQQAALYDAQVAEQNARDAIFRGELAAQAVQRTAAQTAGAQRVAFAGAGVDVNYGTAADLQDETNFFGQVDVARERYNAANEAKGLRQQGSRYLQQAGAYGQAASNVNPLLSGVTTLIGGAASVASKWDQLKPRAPAPITSLT